MFSNLIGNTQARYILERMIDEGKIPHAIILSGPSGVGKKLFAKELAKGIMGEAHSRKIDVQTHPDLRLLYPEGKTAMHSVSSIHQMQEQMALEPFEASSRVFIIDDADKMLPTSSNALLKTLEEPQEGNYFILITKHVDEVIPTILSRCRKIPFFPIPEKEIFEFLKKTEQIDELEAKKVAFLSHGSLEKAMQIIARKENVVRDMMIQILSDGSFHALKHLLAITKIEEYFTSLLDKEESIKYFTEVDSFFEELYYWYRDLHLLSIGANEEYVFHLDSLAVLKKQLSKKRLPLEKVRDLIEESRLAIHRSIKIKTVMEYLFSQISL